MSRFPLDPRLSRTLLRACELRCAATAATVAALLCVEDVFCRAGPTQLLDAAAATREARASPHGEPMTLLNVFQAWRAVPGAERERERWCAEAGLQARALRAAEEVRVQLMGLLPRSSAEEEEAEERKRTEGGKGRRERWVGEGVGGGGGGGG
eukprot:6212067-Pleurochrysis_carterae.AAC.4